MHVPRSSRPSGASSPATGASWPRSAGATTAEDGLTPTAGRRGSRLGERATPLRLKLLVAFGLASLVAVLVPQGGGGEAAPPVGTLLLAAVLIGAVTVGALLWGVRSDLGLPAKVAVYAAGYNALIVLVKFVLAPDGFYEVNQEISLTGLLTLGDTEGAVLTALLVFALYLIAYVVIYRLYRRRLPGRSVDAARVRRGILAVLGGALLLSAVGGSVLTFLVVPILISGSALEYLQFVFTSSASVLIALALAGAVSLAALAFRSVAERAALVGDAAVLVSFFWLGLYFLALYHALWVVYVLILTSIWPLRAVVPK
ncbi:MAG: hypothetical protein H0V40_12720 [Actinobacteria bacterium]|nr:hypothetical protein [Actinomycetota bacterium]